MRPLSPKRFPEQIVHRLLSQGAYRHHCIQLGQRLDEVRPRAIEVLRNLGLTIACEPEAGFYAWADLGKGVDAYKVASMLLDQGHLTAPGELFSAGPDSFMRFNLTELRPEFLGALEKIVKKPPLVPKGIRDRLKSLQSASSA